jgi:hypothetical protein
LARRTDNGHCVCCRSWMFAQQKRGISAGVATAIAVCGNTALGRPIGRRRYPGAYRHGGRCFDP